MAQQQTMKPQQLKARLQAALDLVPGSQRSLEAAAEYRAAIGALGPAAGPLVASGPEWEALLRDGRALHVRAPAYVTLARALEEARAGMRAALERAGILEHRALCTGATSDADAYTQALRRVDEAAARLWELEATGAAARRGAGPEGGEPQPRPRPFLPPTDGELSLMVRPPELRYEDGGRVRRRVAAQKRADRITRAYAERRRAAKKEQEK